MSVVWLLLIAVLLPLGTGLASLLLPSEGGDAAGAAGDGLGPLLAFGLIAGSLDLADATRHGPRELHGSVAHAGGRRHRTETHAGHDNASGAR